MNLKRFVYICSVWRNYQQKMSLNRRPLVACCTVYSVHIRQMDANKCCSTRKGSGSSSWSDEIICGVVRKFSILVGNIDEKSEDTANVFKWYHKELRTITPTLRMIPNTCCIQQHLRMIPQTFKDNTANICGIIVTLWMLPQKFASNLFLVVGGGDIITKNKIDVLMANDGYFRCQMLFWVNLPLNIIFIEDGTLSYRAMLRQLTTRRFVWCSVSRF